MAAEFVTERFLQSNQAWRPTWKQPPSMKDIRNNGKGASVPLDVPLIICTSSC
jgi:hypothetical protein